MAQVGQKTVVREKEKAEKGLYLEIKVAGERVGSKRHVSNLREGLQIGKRDGKVFNENQEGKRQIMEDLTRPFKNRL